MELWNTKLQFAFFFQKIKTSLTKTEEFSFDKSYF